jgi:hypothetical protein
MRNSTLIVTEQAKHMANQSDTDIHVAVFERIDTHEDPIGDLRAVPDDVTLIAVTVRKGGAFILQGDDLHYYGTWARFLRLLHAGGWRVRTGSYRVLPDNLLAVVERATEDTEFDPPEELVSRHESLGTDGSTTVYWEDRADGPDSLNWVDLPLPENGA